MKQWEYEILDTPNGTRLEIENWLNKKGKDGWEVCSCDNTKGTVIFVFKRILKQGHYEL